MSAVERLLQAEYTAVRDVATRHAQAPWLLERAAADLGFARSVFLVGVGKSGLVAQRAAASMRSVGVRATFLHATEICHGDAGVFEPGDALLVVSQSGRTAEVLAASEVAREAGITITVAITAGGEFWTRAIVLDSTIRAEGGPDGIIPLASCAAQAAWCDALLVQLMTSVGEDLTERIKARHPGGAIGELRA